MKIRTTVLDPPYPVKGAEAACSVSQKTDTASHLGEPPNPSLLDAEQTKLRSCRPPIPLRQTDRSSKHPWLIVLLSVKPSKQKGQGPFRNPAPPWSVPSCALCIAASSHVRPNRACSTPSAY